VEEIKIAERALKINQRKKLEDKKKKAKKAH